MSTEQERANFDDWYARNMRSRIAARESYLQHLLFEAWIGRAALQSQEPKTNSGMLSAIIRMPFDMAMKDHFSRVQFYQRAQQALNELEALQSQDRDDSQWRADDVREFTCIGNAINRAATDLPENWRIRISLELGAGTVYLSAPDGTETMIDMSGEVFSDQISAAIDHARRAEGGVE